MASRVLTIHVDLDQLQRITTIGAVISWALAGVFAAGELLGWWHDAGELGIVVSIVTAVPLTVLTLLLSATKGQARALVLGVAAGNQMMRDGNRKLDEANRKLDESNRQHDETNRKLDAIAVLLTNIRDRLGAGAP
ncbi:MAG TPA: hypothetical protein VGR28_06435 [Candidatus Thermoplasmatota archaeon]|jgi:hypothetical protein|nr:hypothetical protein [Candidatus Thermoplasmatota archaeon]